MANTQLADGHLSTRALMQTAPRPQVVFEKGEGAWLWDANGHRYLDFVQGWGVNALGHASPVVARAVAQQVSRLVTPGPGYFNGPALALASSLAARSGLDQVTFVNSGAEANEAAIKLARRWGSRYRGGAYEIVTFERSFHGRTLATMSASGKPAFARLFEPKVPGFPKARLNDLDSVAALLGPRTAAVLVEPIQGEAGVRCATDAFLRDLRALTAEAGVLLILDEVQAGMGRTGRLWAHEYAGIRPDMMTAGKMLGGGLPLAALLATDAVACFEPGDHGGTLGGNALATAVGAAVLDAVSAPGFVATVNDRGQHMLAGLRALSTQHGLGEVRGRGLLVALDLGRPIASTVEARARAAGLLINAAQPDTLRFMPALNVTGEEIDQMLATLDAMLAGAPGDANVQEPPTWATR